MRKRKKKGLGSKKARPTERASAKDVNPQTSAAVDFRPALNVFQGKKKAAIAAKRPRDTPIDGKKKKKKRRVTPMSPEVELEVLAEKPAKSVHTMPAGTNGCRTFFADEIQKEVSANVSVENYLRPLGQGDGGRRLVQPTAYEALGGPRRGSVAMD